MISWLISPVVRRQRQEIHDLCAVIAANRERLAARRRRISELNRQIFALEDKLVGSQSEVMRLERANERQAEMLHAQEDRLARAEGRPVPSAEVREFVRHNATVDAMTQAAEDRSADVDADREQERI